jgi:hypothetical protein
MLVLMIIGFIWLIFLTTRFGYCVIYEKGFLYRILGKDDFTWLLYVVLYLFCGIIAVLIGMGLFGTFWYAFICP